MQSSFDKKDEIYQLFMQAPVGIYLLKGEDYIIEMANEPILTFWGKGSGVIGKPVLESFPEIKEQGFIDILDNVRKTGKSFQTDEIAVWYNYEGKKEQKYVTLFYQPYYEEGSIAGIFSIATDVTEKVVAKKQLEENERNLRNLILQAPVAMCIFKGPDYIVEIANARMVAFWGKKAEEVIGKPIFEGLHEVKNQGFEDLLHKVYTEGVTVRVDERPVMLPRAGGLQTIFVNFVYEPLREQVGSITGVMAMAVDVTEQVLSRIKIEDSAQEVRSLVESAPFPIGVYIGKEMLIRLANKSITDVWGKGPDVIGKRYADVLPELKDTGIYDQLDAVFTTGVPFHAKNQRVDLVVDGKLQPFYFNYSFTPLFDKEGHVYGVMNTAAEVTDLNVALQKIQEAEEKARLAIDSAELGTYQYDFVHKVLTTSKRFHAIFGGLVATEIDSYIQSIHTDDLSIREAAHQEALKTGFLQYEVRVKHPDDNYRWARIQGRYLFDEENSPVRLIGIAQDITEQRIFAEELGKQVKERTKELEAAQQTLLDAYRYLQTVINKFESAFASLTPVFTGEEITDFRFKMTNEAYSAYSHNSPEAIQGKLVSEFFPGYKQTEAFENYVHTFRTGLPAKWDLHYDFDGLDVYLTVSCSRVENEVIAHFTDFTTLKSLQYELIRKIEELKDSNSNLEDFAYAASHDLKEPIRKIHFFADLLKQELKGQLNASQERYFERLENASSRMKSLVNDLLAYSQATKGAGLQEEVDLNKKVRLVIEDLELEIAQRKASIHVDPLPVILANKRQMQQLFQNLISNALKYGKPGEAPQVFIHYTLLSGNDIPAQPGLEKQKTYHQIEITDKGIGFPQADAEQIFNVFIRLHNSTESSGSGVGLSIVQKVVQNHRGFIQAESKLGEGSTFRVLLPAD
jgi:PAS domain S-box-containing protein